MTTKEITDKLAELGYKPTERTINDSFIHGCIIWENKGNNTYLTDYNVGLTISKNADLKKNDILILFRPGTQLLPISTKLLNDKITFNKIINEFITAIKETKIHTIKTHIIKPN